MNSIAPTTASLPFGPLNPRANRTLEAAMLDALAIVWLVSGWIVVLVSDSILPARYFFDNQTLLAVIGNPNLRAGGSFGTTALIYRYLYPLGVPDRIVVGLINHTIVVLCVLACMRRSPLRHSRLSLLVLTSWVLLAAVFVGMLSKEIFSVIAVAGAVLALVRNERSGPALACAWILAYAAVRSYWLVVLAYGVGIWFLVMPRPRLAVRILSMALLVLTASIVFHAATHLYISDVRNALNHSRAGNANVASMIQNPLRNSSAVTDVANQLFAWLNFMLPLRLLASGVVQQAGFAVWQIFNFCVVFLAFKRGGTSVKARTYTGLVTLALAITLVLSAFDGDFGSYTRHQIALLPIVAFILGMDNRREVARLDGSIAARSAPVA